MAFQHLTLKDKAWRLQTAKQIAARGGNMSEAARACGMSSGSSLRRALEAQGDAVDIVAQLRANGRRAAGKPARESKITPRAERLRRLGIASDHARDGRSLIDAAKACGLVAAEPLKLSIAGFEGGPEILAQLAENGRKIRAGKVAACGADAAVRGVRRNRVKDDPAPAAPCDAPDRAPDCAPVAVVARPAPLVRLGSGAAVRASLPAGFGSSFKRKGGRGNE